MSFTTLTIGLLCLTLLMMVAGWTADILRRRGERRSFRGKSGSVEFAKDAARTDRSLRASLALTAPETTRW